MQKRRLGQTDLEVSVLSLGTVKFGRNAGVKYPEHFELPSMLELETLLGVAFDLGINLIDTAPAYGESETRLGALLKNKRHQCLISSKVGEQFINGQSFFDFSPLAIQQSVDHSLRRLQTDYLDILLVHSHGDDIQLIVHDEVFVTLSELKDAGKVRAFGMSTKTIEGGLATIDLADVAMISYNPIYCDEKAVITYAHEEGKGIMIKKAFASGNIHHALNCDDPYGYALQFALQEPGVSSVVIGTINQKHLRESVLSASL